MIVGLDVTLVDKPGVVMAHKKTFFSITTAFVALCTSVYAECVEPTVSDSQLTADLHLAIVDRQPEVVRQVLSQGANPDWAVPGRTDFDGGVFELDSRTPLLEALNLAEAQIAFDLLNANADPNLSFWEDAGDGFTPLGLAINRGDEASARFLTAFGADHHSVRCNGTESSLHYAASLAHPEIVDLLRERIPDSKAILAAVSAEPSGSDTRPEVEFKNDQAEVLRLLTLDGFDPNGTEAHEAILLAVLIGRADLVKVLLNAGVSTEATDKRSRLEPTLLLLAALKGDLFMVNVLLSAGADAQVFDSHGNSALMYAAAGGNVDVVQEFGERDVPTNRNLFEQSALFFATQPTVVPALSDLAVDVNVKDALGRTALHVAVNPSPILSHPNAPVLQDPVGIARALLQAGADPEITDVQGHTPLMVVARGRRDERGKMASLLMTNGSSLDGLDIQGNAVLHHFADTGDLSIISEVIENGGAVSARDASGRTALHRILLSDEITSDRLGVVIDEGLALGLPVDIPDNDGRSALHVLATRFHDSVGEDLARQLLEAGANPNLLSNFDATPVMEAVAADNGAVLSELGRADGTEIDLVSGDGITVLGLAAEAGKVKMIRILLELGASSQIANPDGDTALHMSLNARQKDAALLLIAHGGTEVVAANAMGETPLILAAQNNQHEASIALLARGANVCLADKEDKRAIDYAQRPQKLDSASLAIQPIGVYVAAVRKYREDLREFNRRLRRELDDLERGIERPRFPREQDSLGSRAFGLGSQFVDPDRFGPSPPSLFTQTDYYNAMAICTVSLITTDDLLIGPNGIDEDEEVQCISEAIRNGHIHQAERRIRQSSPVTWRALWALDTAFLEIGLIARSDLPPLPFTNAPLPADYPTSSQLTESMRVADREGLWGTCDGHPLYLGAAVFGNVPVVDQWYRRELSLTVRDKSGRTASTLASRNGHTDAVQAIAANADATIERIGAALTADAFGAAISNAGTDLDTALLYVESSVDKDEADGTGLRPLMQAVRAGTAGLAVLFVLLERGADVDAGDNDGATALHYAASTGNLEAGKLLHRYGASVAAQNASGETPRQIAEQNFHNTFVDWLDSL